MTQLEWEGETATEGFNFWQALEEAEEAYLETGNRQYFIDRMMTDFGFTLAQANDRADDLDTEGSF